MLRTQHCFYFTSVDVLEASLRLVPVLQHEEELEAELPAGVEAAAMGAEEHEAEQPAGVEVAVVGAESELCFRFLEAFLWGLFFSHDTTACRASSTSWLSWN